MEKEYLVQNADVTELDFFKQDLKNLNYEDYCDFIADFINAVSYTHLTLPTNREV
mgnify:CR=1 FL=1